MRCGHLVKMERGFRVLWCQVPGGKKKKILIKREAKLLANTKQLSWIMKRILEILGNRGSSPEMNQDAMPL